MTISHQLHNSATHAEGLDPNCPACASRIDEHQKRAIIAQATRNQIFETAFDSAGETGREIITNAALHADALDAGETRESPWGSTDICLCAAPDAVCSFCPLHGEEEPLSGKTVRASIGQLPRCRRCKGSGTEPANSRATATPEHLHEVRRKAALASAEARRNRKTVMIDRAEWEKFLESRKS